MPTIKGTVTRVVSESNFYIIPIDHGHRSMDLEGHRVGSGEISIECHPTELAKGNPSKIARWTGKLPKPGDTVEVQARTPRGSSAVADEQLDPPSDEEIQAEARRRIRAQQIQKESEKRVAAEMARLQGEQGGAGDPGAGGAAPTG